MEFMNLDVVKEESGFKKSEKRWVSFKDVPSLLSIVFHKHVHFA